MIQSPMTVYLSLGANLGDREAQLRRALEEIESRIGRIVRQSGFFVTQPWGFQSDNLFLNACVAVETALSPQDLLERTQAIERRLGRVAKTSDGHYADRPIDIDILLYADQRISTPGLHIPHPRMTDRMFVLEPLAQIAPDVVIPGVGKTVAQLLGR